MLRKMVEVHDVEDDEVKGEEDDVENDVEEDDVGGGGRLPKVGTQTFVRAFAVEMRIDVAEESLCARNYRKKPGPRSATHTCAVDKFWTFHKSHFMREFTGKMLGPRSATQTLCEPAQVMHLDISQEPFCARIYRKNARAQKRDADFVRACADRPLLLP